MRWFFGETALSAIIGLVQRWVAQIDLFGQNLIALVFKRL